MDFAPIAPAATPGSTGGGGSGWGWNPLTDIIHGVSLAGDAINKYTKIGNFNPGIGSALSAVANFLPGIANASVQAGEHIGQGLSTGNWTPLSTEGAQIGGGLLKSVADLGTDVATAGGLAPYTGKLESGVQSLTGYKPNTLRQYAMQPGEGLAGAGLSDAMNLLMGADGVTKLAEAGDLGTLASAARDATTLAQKEAVDAGLPGDKINEAGNREAAAKQVADKNAAAMGEDPESLAKKIQARMATLDRIDSFKSGVKSAVNPLRTGGPVYELGRAANADLTGSSGVSGVEVTPVTGEAPQAAAQASGAPAGSPVPETAETAHKATQGVSEQGRVRPAAESPTTPQESVADLVKAAVNQEHAKAALQQEMTRQLSPNGTTTLFRGEGLDTGNGSTVVDPGSGPWYTDNAETAARYAEGGKVLKVDVPNELVEAAKSHPMFDEGGKSAGTAYDLGKLGDQGHQFDQIARILGTPEEPLATSPDPTDPTRALEKVPAEYKSFIERSKPIPEWAVKAEAKMPDVAKQLLKWSDDLRLRYTGFKISRQNERAVAANGMKIWNTPEFLAARQQITDLVHQRIPDITPSVANEIVTDMIRNHAVLPEGLWENVEQNREALDAAEPGLADRILDRRIPVPAEINTADFRTQVRQIAEPIRQMFDTLPEQLRENPRVGEKGNFDTNPTLTRKDMADLNKAADLAEKAAKIITDKVPGERQAAYDQAFEMTKEITRRIEGRQGYVRVTKNLNDLIDILNNHHLDSEVAAASLNSSADDLRRAVSDRIAERTPPPIWQPFVRAVTEAAAAVQHYPELEELFTGLPGIMDDALGYAKSIGWDPTYMPEMTESRVRQLINGTARLGGKPGEEFTSGARKVRTGALNAMGGDARNLEMLAAGLNQAVQEARTNNVVDWLDRVVAQDIPRNNAGRRSIPGGMTAWDPIRRGMLAFTSNGENVAVPGEHTQMIPTTVAKLLREYQNTDNPFSRAMAKITNPWRSLQLTLNPGFYAKHVIGHVMLAMLAGAGPSDLLRGFQAVRSGDLPEVTGLSIIKNELGEPGLVKYTSMSDAIAHEGTTGWVHYMADKLHNAMATSDAMARAAVYLKDVRNGLSPMEALQHSMDALVDYGNLSPTERYITRAIVPFYSFSKGVFQVAMRMPFDHPLTAAIILKLGQWQGEQAKDDNGNPLPSAYQGVVSLPGLGKVNLSKFSPFKDIASLTTPEGVVSSLQYALQAVVRSGLGVGAPGTKAGTKVNAYGQVVPDVSLGSQLAASFTNSPLGTVGSTGNFLRFLGVSQVPDATLNKAGARNVISQGEMANTTQAQQQQAAAFPVDTQGLQMDVQKNVAAGQPMQAPAPLAGQPPAITQAQLEAAVAQQLAAQQQKAATTRAAKGGGSRARRSGGGSRTRSGGGGHLKSFGRKSGGGGLKSFGGKRSIGRVSKASVHQSIGRLARGSGGGSPFKSSGKSGRIRQAGPVKLQKRPR